MTLCIEHFSAKSALSVVYERDIIKLVQNRLHFNFIYDIANKTQLLYDTIILRWD